MADHNYTTDTYERNTAIFNDCKKLLSEITLPTESFSQFGTATYSLEDIMVRSINNALGEISNIFEGQAYTYRFAKSSVCEIDEKYASKFDEPISDIGRFILTINSMNNLMNVKCSANTFVGLLESNMNNILASGIASIELSDYMIQNDSGEYLYNIDAIRNLFREIYCKDRVTQKDAFLIESLLYSCASGDEIDADNLEKILNASLDTTAASGAHKDCFPEMWNRISHEMCTYTEVIIKQNDNILVSNGRTLSSEELELKSKIKSLVMVNDIIKAMSSRASSILASRVQGEETLVEEIQYTHEEDFLLDYMSKYGITGLFDAKRVNEYNDAHLKKIEDAARAGHISLSYHSKGDTNTLLPYLEFNVSDSPIALIQEFTSASNTSLLKAGEHVSILAAESYLKSFINEDVEGITEDEYLNKNYTINDELDEKLSYIKAIPVVGEAVSFTETVLDAEFAIIDSMIIEEMNEEQQPKTVNSVLDAAGELAGKIPDDNSKVKVATETVKIGTRLVKTNYNDNEKQEKIRKEYQNKVRENEELKHSIEEIKAGKVAIDQLAIINGATDESTGGAARYSFSFIYYIDTQEVDTSLKLKNNR